MQGLVLGKVAHSLSGLKTIYIEDGGAKARQLTEFLQCMHFPQMLSSLTRLSLCFTEVREDYSGLGISALRNVTTMSMVRQFIEALDDVFDVVHDPLMME